MRRTPGALLALGRSGAAAARLAPCHLTIFPLGVSTLQVIPQAHPGSAAELHQPRIEATLLLNMPLFANLALPCHVFGFVTYLKIPLCSYCGP